MKKKSIKKFYIFFLLDLVVYSLLTFNLAFADMSEKPQVTANVTTKPNNKLATISQPNVVNRIVDPPKTNHFPYGQCTWYVATKRNVSWNGNAISWLSNAKASGRKVGRLPKKGAIVVMNTGYYGHVGYVEEIRGDSFTFSEMNYIGWAKYSKRTMKANDKMLIGFIY